LAFGGLLLLDLGTIWLMLRQVRRGGAGVLLEAALAPTGRPSRFDEMLVATNFNPLRLLRVAWSGDWAALEQLQHQTASIAGTGAGASAHGWRRLLEVRRTPLRNGLAILLMGLVPLQIYDPSDDYSLLRLITAIIFSTSLGTQLFNDAADHLRYANLELSAPISRWQILWYVQVPRLVIYWLGGILLLAGVVVFSSYVEWFDILALVLWYPLILTSMLALRSVLVFVFPAAGLPGQRDPVQAMLVTLANGFLLLTVVMLSLVPFWVLLLLDNTIDLSPLLIWPVVFTVSSAICLASCMLLVWAYRHYEPQE
ncbi:MAG: hypothetical protein HC914_20705, partial [Chloroflexaceae bacterium]|nr:hypothetical protein [Chloroflexaceae bacterium]